MYNFVALWVRLIEIIFLTVIVTAIVLFFGRKQFKKWEKIVTICLAVLMLVLGGGYTFKSLVAPDVKTITGIFESEMRANQRVSFFEWEYCFVSENEKVYVELDSISKNIMFDEEFIKGQEYIVSYEEESNLIVAIQKTTTQSRTND